MVCRSSIVFAPSLIVSDSMYITVGRKEIAERNLPESSIEQDGKCLTRGEAKMVTRKRPSGAFASWRSIVFYLPGGLYMSSYATLFMHPRIKQQVQ